MSKWIRDVKREILANPHVTRAEVEVTRKSHLRANVTFTDGRTRQIRTSSTPSDWRTLKDVARKVRAAALGEDERAAA